MANNRGNAAWRALSDKESKKEKKDPFTILYSELSKETSHNMDKKVRVPISDFPFAKRFEFDAVQCTAKINYYDDGFLLDVSDSNRKSFVDKVVKAYPEFNLKIKETRKKDWIFLSYPAF